jgi:hypothetical protein
MRRESYGKEKIKLAVTRRTGIEAIAMGRECSILLSDRSQSLAIAKGQQKFKLVFLSS